MLHVMEAIAQYSLLYINFAKSEIPKGPLLGLYEQHIGDNTVNLLLFDIVTMGKEGVVEFCLFIL